MRVETSTYEFSHGRKPKGYGLWLFGLTFSGPSVQTFSHTGNYGDAKKAAVKAASEQGANAVEVLP